MALALMLLVGSITTSAGAEDGRLSRNALPAPLLSLLETLRPAAQARDIRPFIDHVSPSFEVLFDSGGGTSPDKNAFANFSYVFGFSYPAPEDGSSHPGWDSLSKFLSGGSFQQVKGAICTPYYPPEVSIWDRTRLCFEQSPVQNRYGGWQISLFAFIAH